eukprot:TRINITY_DN1047_c3_g1_i1.p5 TRINITY_DN1047_c3_g1~~TRINITY_DN1047_c3_g1_i1.p5  ORF type:complete len:107 (+),score=0.19 TRINITY_DN1047_c3_g1_i1:1282-1602(+)
MKFQVQNKQLCNICSFISKQCLTKCAVKTIYQKLSKISLFSGAKRRFEIQQTYWGSFEVDVNKVKIYMNTYGIYNFQYKFSKLSNMGALVLSQYAYLQLLCVQIAD